MPPVPRRIWPSTPAYDALLAAARAEDSAELEASKYLVVDSNTDHAGRRVVVFAPHLLPMASTKSTAAMTRVLHHLVMPLCCNFGSALGDFLLPPVPTVAPAASIAYPPESSSSLN